MEEERVIRIQAVVRGWLIRLKYGDVVRRFDVVQEILRTERSHVEALEALQNVYSTPLIPDGRGPNGTILTRVEHEKLFGKLEAIVNVNRQMLSNLLDRNKNQTIGQVFSTFAPWLKLYSYYCSHYEEAMNLVREKMENSPPFRAFVDVALHHPDAKLQTLESLLIRPVQRIVKYTLLLKELMKCMNEGDSEYQSLKSAISSLNSTSSYVNEKIRERENQRKVIDIQKLISGAPKNLVQPHRKFLASGTLVKMSNRAVQSRKIYLFNDMLVYCRRVLNRFRFSGHIPLSVSPMPWIRDLPDLTTVKNLFQLVVPNRTYTFVGKNVEHKQFWMATIHGAIQDLIANLPDMKGKPMAQLTFLKVNKFWKAMGAMSPEQYDPEYEDEQPIQRQTRSKTVMNAPPEVGHSTDDTERYRQSVRLVNESISEVQSALAANGENVFKQPAEDSVERRHTVIGEMRCDEESTEPSSAGISLYDATEVLEEVSGDDDNEEVMDADKVQHEGDPKIDPTMSKVEASPSNAEVLEKELPGLSVRELIRLHEDLIQHASK